MEGKIKREREIEGRRYGPRRLRPRGNRV